MAPHIADQISIDPEIRDFYCQTLNILRDKKLPFLVGGAYALERHTGIARNTKDLDLMVRPQDCQRILEVFAEAGYQTEITVPHWLAKIYQTDELFVDLIFNTGNGCSPVSDDWFADAPQNELFGTPVLVCPLEEMIWSKAFIMARDRFDGADIAHLVLLGSDRLNWKKLIQRFESHWRVLLSHLVLFGYIYPGEKNCIPDWVMHELMQRIQQESNPSEGSSMNTLDRKICQGTLLAPMQYQIDVKQLGYIDARLQPTGNLTPGDLEEWIEHLKEETNLC